ncbi:MAG: DUF5723 family protein [Bacteroidales bacterium]
MRKYILPLIILCCTLASKAQDKGMAFLKGTPQSNVINPAFRLNDDDNFYISLLPVMGGTSISVANTGFSWNDLFYEKQDSLYLDFDKLDSKLQKKNYTNVNTSFQIISFGFKAGEKSFFTFDMNVKTKTSITLPGDITQIRYGNWDYDNNTPINQSLSGISADGMAYTELAFGYNRKITDKLTAGIRLKYIMGALAVKTEHAKLNMITANDGSVTIDNDISIITSGPIHATFDKENKVDGIEFDDNLDPSDFISKNIGFGVDLGATYQLTDKIMLAAAVNDIGFINWKNNPQHFYSKGSFVYDGADVSDNITDKAPEGQDLWGDIGDSLGNSFNVDNAVESSFNTGLMFNANVMGTYKFREWVDFGAMLALDHNWSSSLTLSASLNPARALSGVVTYSINKNDFAGIGTGLMVRGGCLQFYCMTDNIISYLSPANAKYVNLRFGMNLIFGGGHKKNKIKIDEDKEELSMLRY